MAILRNSSPLLSIRITPSPASFYVDNVLHISERALSNFLNNPPANCLAYFTLPACRPDVISAPDSEFFELITSGDDIGVIVTALAEQRHALHPRQYFIDMLALYNRDRARDIRFHSSDQSSIAEDVRARIAAIRSRVGHYDGDDLSDAPVHDCADLYPSK